MSEKRKPLRCSKCKSVMPNAKGDTLDYARIASILGGNVYCPKCEPAIAKSRRAMTRIAR